MTGALDGRLALITGAGSGIGEAIAHAMAKAGARIIVADIDEGAAQSTAMAIGGQAASFACDVTDRAGCDGLAASIRSRIGPISILVNNAGIIRRATVTAASTREDWDATLAVNLDGPYNMVTAFLDQLGETKGSIINIGSIQSFVVLPNSAAYTTSKGGVRMLTKALAIELESRYTQVIAMRIPPTAIVAITGVAKRRFTLDSTAGSTRWLANPLRHGTASVAKVLGRRATDPDPGPATTAEREPSSQGESLLETVIL